jgi:uncharacterized membrane protein
MAYLDSAGNVDPASQATVELWQEFHRKQAALLHVKVTPVVPSAAIVSGAEKAGKGEW